jgi:hypothetical protein
MPLKSKYNFDNHTHMGPGSADLREMANVININTKSNNDKTVIK